jgi:hypothetical protein
MPREVGIHDFADAGARVVDGGPAPAMTMRALAVGQTLGHMA